MRTCPPSHGEAAWFGLPDLQVYGCRVRTPHVLALLVATYLWGWRGLLLGLLVLYLHLIQRHASVSSPSTSPGVVDAVRQYWQRPSNARATSEGPGAPAMASRNRDVGASRPSRQGNGPFTGRAYRLDG